MRLLLRLESCLSLAALLLVYAALDGSWGVFFKYFFLPDLALLVFLIQYKAGSIAYNITRSFLLPAALLGIAAYKSHQMDHIYLSLIWLSHIHFDRALGYGLKRYGTFRETHLGTVGKDTAPATESKILESRS